MLGLPSSAAIAHPDVDVNSPTLFAATATLAGREDGSLESTTRKRIVAHPVRHGGPFNGLTMK